MTIIAPIRRLKDPLGVVKFTDTDQNQLLLLKRFGELYRQYTILDSCGVRYTFCRYLKKSTTHFNQRYVPRLLASGRTMDDRPEFSDAYVTDSDLKRCQRYLHWKAFFSRVKSERRLYKLIVEEKSFVLNALHTFVHSWLPELPDDARSSVSDDNDIYDLKDRYKLINKLCSLENERMDRIASIRILPTTTDPRFM